MSFASALLLLFIALKLVGIITWSWLWILSPLWGGVLLMFILVMTFGIKGTHNTKRRPF